MIKLGKTCLDVMIELCNDLYSGLIGDVEIKFDNSMSYRLVATTGLDGDGGWIIYLSDDVGLWEVSQALAESVVSLVGRRRGSNLSRADLSNELAELLNAYYSRLKDSFSDLVSGNMSDGGRPFSEGDELPFYVKRWSADDSFKPNVGGIDGSELVPDGTFS